jgi:hypothetical protein
MYALTLSSIDWMNEPVAQRGAHQRGRERLRDRETGPAAGVVEAQAVALQAQLSVLHDQERGASLAGHVGGDVQRQFERRAGRERHGRAAGRDHARGGEDGQAIERAKRGVALRLRPEEEVAVGGERRQQAARFLVEGEPSAGSGEGGGCE